MTAEKKRPEGVEVVCLRCGEPQAKHVPVNHSDGQMVGATVLLCPTATFQDPRTKP